MTINVVEVPTVTNVIEVLQSPIQVVEGTISHIVTEVNSTTTVVETSVSTFDITISSPVTTNIVEIPIVSNSIESIQPKYEITSTVDTFTAYYSEDTIVYSKRIDTIDDTLLYKGEAAVGSANSSNVWRIRKITIINDDINELWAEGSAEFNKVWDNRLSYTYS